MIEQTMDERGVYIFDVCGTLFYDDTTVGLLRWHFQRTGRAWPLRLLTLLFNGLSPGNFVIKVIERLTGCHFAKHLAIGLLRNETVCSLQTSAEQYVDHLLRERTVAPVFELFQRQAAAGSTTILASASVEPVIAELGRRFGSQHVCSRLEHRRGRYTGRLQTDLTGRKVAALSELPWEIRSQETHCFTDNLTDVELLQLCRHRYVVLHGPNHRRRWSLDNVTFVSAS
jgi:phosphoserine phosphatase